MHNFDDPYIKLDELKNVRLDPFTHLVQSLRCFTCNVSMLIAGYQHYIASKYVLTNQAKKMSNEEYAAAYYYFYAFQSDVLIRIRNSCEPNEKSLSSGAINNLLSVGDNINELKKYIYKNGDDFPGNFEKIIEYIKLHCGRLSTPSGKITDNSESLLKKISLVRRMANKLVAHLTFDDYKVNALDIDDVIFAISTVACAIQSIMGDLACPTKLEVAERMAFEIACRNTPSEYLIKIIPLIQELLPAWVEENQINFSSV